MLSLITRKRATLGHMLLLDINRKPHMGSPMAASHLTLGDLERSNVNVKRQGHPDFEALYLAKEPS